MSYRHKFLVFFGFFCLPYQKGQLVKERICSSKYKFFPSRVDPIVEGLQLPGKQTGSYLFPFVKLVGKNIGLYPDMLRLILFELKQCN